VLVEVAGVWGIRLPKLMETDEMVKENGIIE